MGWDSEKAEFDSFVSSGPKYPVSAGAQEKVAGPAKEQKQDLNSLKRLLAIQDAVGKHVTALRAAAVAVVELINVVNESMIPIQYGAMPDWFETASSDVSDAAQSIVMNMEYIANRLDADYIG